MQDNDTNIIVYDLETQKTFQEVGGYGNTAQLGISYAGVYSYAQDKLFGFKEGDLPTLERILATERPTIVGFNSINFDNVVMQPYFKHLNIQDLPQIDILAEIHERLGFRIKLESVAQATLGAGKSGDGLDAIRYYRAGDWDSLAKYCLDDVKITRDVFEYGRNHGFILYTSGGDLLRMPVSWAKTTSYSEIIAEAFKQKQRLHIEYLHIAEAGNTRTNEEIDILEYKPELQPDVIEVYSHGSQAKQTYSINRILSLQVTAEKYATQGTLL